MSASTPLRRRHGNVDGLGSARRALSPLALTADPKDVFGGPASSSSNVFVASPPPQRRAEPPASPLFLRSAKSKRAFDSPERHTRASSRDGDFREGGLLSPKKRFVPGQDVPLSPLKRRHGHRARSDSVSSVGSVGSMLDEEMLGSDAEADEAADLFPRWTRAEDAVVKGTPDKTDKGKGRQTDEAEGDELETTVLERRAAAATRPVNLDGVREIASQLRAAFPNSSSNASVSRSLARATSSARASASRSSASSASRSRARASSSRALASRNSASRAVSRASYSSSSAAAASSASSLASLQASVSSLFVSAASSVNSAISAGETPATAAAASTASSALAASSASAAAAAASASSVAAADASATSAASAASAAESLASASASASAISSAGSNSTANGSALGANATNRTKNLERIVIPSVVVPVVALLALIAIICCCRRKRNKERQGILHSPTPSSFGVMGSPRGNYAATGGFGGGPMFGGQKAGYAGSEAGLVVGPNPNAVMSERAANQSIESFATSPSAIGVAVGEGAYGKGEGPVTVWGRRSLRDVVASGSAAASSMMSSPEEPVPSRPDRQTQAGSYIAGRQPSIASMRGSIDGPIGYQPGQLRPVYTPDRGNITSPTHFDPFPAAALGVGAAAGASALDHGIRPVSDAPTEFSEDNDNDNRTESYYGGILGTQSGSTPLEMRSPLSDQTEDLEDASVNGEGATSDPRSSGYDQPFNLNALQSQYADGQSQPATTDNDDIFSDPPSSQSSPEVAPVNFNSSSGESEAEGTVGGTPRQAPRVAAEQNTPTAGGAGGEGEKWW